MIYFNMTCKKHFMLKHYRGMYESRHHYLDLVHIWIPIFKMEEIKSCAAPNLLGNLRSRRMEQEEFIQPEKAQKEKDEDKNAKETHNGQRDKENETEILIML